MKKVLPLLLFIAITVTGFYLKSRGFETLGFGWLKVEFYFLNSLDLTVDLIATGVMAALSLILLFTKKFTTGQSWALITVIGWIQYKKIVGEIFLTITSLKWLPKITISTLTVITASTIILLTLIIEHKRSSDNE